MELCLVLAVCQERAWTPSLKPHWHPAKWAQPWFMDEETDTERPMMCSESHRIPAQDWRPRSQPKAQLAHRNMEKGQRVREEKRDTDHSLHKCCLPWLSPAGHKVSHSHWTPSGSPHPLFNVELLASILCSPQGYLSPELIGASNLSPPPRAHSSLPRHVDPPQLWFLCDWSRWTCLVRRSLTHSPCSCRWLATWGSLFARHRMLLLTGPAKDTVLHFHG